tara:strand:- start:14 stop:334 length:321 start_codon:yes stop_codon:yes gene_type:complete
MNIKEKILNRMARKKGFKDYNEYSQYFDKMILPSIKNNLKARDKKIEAKKEEIRLYDLETKKLDFCVLCNKKMGFIRYNPKSDWKIKGKLCKKCWYEQKAKNEDII